MDFKLGKKPARFDKRTIPLRTILKDYKMPTFPSSFTFSPTLPLSMYGNDKLGDCVMAGAAECEKRMQFIQSKSDFPITDQEVIHEYFWLTGGPDEGLDMLSTAKFWRKHGLYLGRRQLKLFGFATFEPDHIDCYKATMALIGDIWAGFALPDNFFDQIKTGKLDDTSGAPDPYNMGHCMVGRNYDNDWAYLISYGQFYPASWPFIKKYADETYPLIPQKDYWLPNSPIDPNALDEIMKEITG